ncbi:unnamed protein product [Angiostrongylus costaricensis]|uniref:Helitron_like_N domain-containing protein n=1 Tax=Angiostrongylus costaricensis TaxID=334426 RepID=A0A0R3PH87_ANGCS|nr:unnamed protein product [Angiostrongylus costaricensis]
MSNQLTGPREHVEGNEAHWSYNEHVGPSRSTEFAGNLDFREYVVADGNDWLHPLSDVVYEDVCQFQDLQDIKNVCSWIFRFFSNVIVLMQKCSLQQLDHTEESDFLPDGEAYLEPQRIFFKSLQVVADEAVVDVIPENTVRPQQCFSSFHRDSPQQCVRSNSDHVRQTGRSRQVETVPGTNAVHYIVQNTSLTFETESSHHVQYEVGPSTPFRRPLDQCEGALPPHHVPILRSSSKSQPRRPLLWELDDDSLAYPVQEYDDDCKYDGIEQEDYDNFTEAPDGNTGDLFADEWQEQSNLRPLRTIQRSYFPPNLSPAQKMVYLLANYEKAYARYLPFANMALLESDTRYRPVKPVASDLYRFHSRGAHIHGFFRTVIDSRDRPHLDQTRYIQDIQFGKVFPLNPDYDQWDDSMRSEFRQLSNRLMQIFERKCFYANAGNGHGRAPVVRRGPKPTQKPPPDYAEQQKIQYEGVPRGFRPVRSSVVNQTKLFTTHSASHSSFTPLQCQGPVLQASTDSQSFLRRKPDDFWRTLGHRKSAASETIRAPATDVMRSLDVLMENSPNNTTSRHGAPTSYYPQSASIRRAVTRTVGTNLIDDQGSASSEQTLDCFPVEGTPISASSTEVADRNQVAVRQMKKCSWSLMSKSQSEYSDQYNYTRNVQESVGSSVTTTQKPLKKFSLVRDEHGRLRRLKRSQDGTFLTRGQPY